MKKLSKSVPNCCSIDAPYTGGPNLETRTLSVKYRSRFLLRDVNFQAQSTSITALVGPSGAGKSTMLRALNRMIEDEGEMGIGGEILLRGSSVFAPSIDPDELRRCMGLVFQRPCVFPLSIHKNVIFGVAKFQRLHRNEAADLVEKMLREVNLWEELKDRLHDPAERLSIGQQQRLCIARALALNPELLLLDEPTSALDPVSTESLENLFLRLAEKRTLVLVTHNLAQARRIAQSIAVLGPHSDASGAHTIVEQSSTEHLFASAQHEFSRKFLQLELG